MRGQIGIKPPYYSEEKEAYIEAAKAGGEADGIDYTQEALEDTAFKYFVKDNEDIVWDYFYIAARPVTKRDYYGGSVYHGYDD